MLPTALKGKTLPSSPGGEAPPPAPISPFSKPGGTGGSGVTVTPVSPGAPVIGEAKPIQVDFSEASTMGWYGESNTGKTSQVPGLIEWVWRTYGKKTRYITANDGNFEPIKPYVQLGLAEIFVVSESFRNPQSMVRGLSKGGWLPLRMAEITHQGKTKQQLLLSPRGEDLGEIGCYFLDDFSILVDRCMRSVVSSGRKIGEDVVGKFEEDSALEAGEQETYAAAGRSHYGFAQKFALDMLAAFRSLPVPLVVFSFHEGKGEDGDKNPVYGPSLPGKAAVSKIPQELGVLLHFQTEVEKSGKLLYKAYYQKHPDDKNPMILWPANPRVDASRLHLLEKRFPGGYVPLEPKVDGEAGEWKSSIVDFLEFRRGIAQPSKTLAERLGLINKD